MKIKNNYNIEKFNAKKNIIISNASYLGGKNELMAGLFGIGGVMCVIVLIIFIYKNRVSKGKFGKAL
jgi:hypothetical protein